MKTARIFAVILAVLFGLLLVVRFVGSPFVTRLVNKKLAELPDYTGKVAGGVHLALWRGTVTATDFILYQRGHEREGPMVKIKQASLAIAFRPLFTGKLGGHGSVDGMEVEILKTEPDLPKKKHQPAAVVREWTAVLREAFPVEITRFKMENVRIHFADKSVTPAAELVIDQFKLTATDLSNRPKGEELPAKVTVSARAGGTGRLAVEVRADPAQPEPRFIVRAELKELSLPPIHDFLVHYALIDASQGTFEVFSEVNAANGHYAGYVKPFFKDLEFKAVPDPNKNLAQRAVTKVAAAVTGLLKNDQGAVATKAPFEGDFADNKVGVWEAVQNLLRNAFIQSLREGLEGQTSATHPSETK